MNNYSVRVHEPTIDAVGCCLNADRISMANSESKIVFVGIMAEIYDIKDTQKALFAQCEFQTK